MCSGGHTWQGTCVVWGMCGWGHEWQGCEWFGVSVGVCMAWGHAWFGVSMAGGMHDKGYVWQERGPLQRTVCILLGYILVINIYLRRSIQTLK